MNKNSVLGIAAAMFVLLGGAWAWGWFDGGDYSDDPAVAELERERDAMFAKRDQLSEDERKAQGQVLRDRAEGLTPEQRMKLWESSAPLIVPMMAKRFEQEYDKFMAKSPEEQRKELDRKIDEMEKRGSPRAGGGDGKKPPFDPKKADEFRKKMLDWTTPDQRSKFENGIQMMNDRRKERGLPPVSGRGGRSF